MSRSARSPHLPLLAATFVLAVAGLVYELLAGTVSAYLLGSSVYQFSIVIGLFMSAMGLGAWLSRHIEAPEPAFVAAQTALGLIGGGSALLLFFAYVLIDNYNVVLVILCVLTGALIGLEIPLVTRILSGHGSLRVNISNILTADYVGALAAAILFPLILVPQLGLIQTGLVFGLLNLAVAGMALWLFGVMRQLRWWLPATALMIAAFIYSERLTGFLEGRLFEAEIVLAENTPYQRLVVTHWGERTQLFLDGHLQFDTIDEYRYHEALVHPVMRRAVRIENVLVLGGGDGMAARELLRYPEIERITLVDLDPRVTELFRDQPELRALNGESLSDPRVHVSNADAWKFLEAVDDIFDVAIIDLPDPHSLDISRLYTLSFYRLLMSRMSLDGLVVTQAGSPLFARDAFWCIEQTLAATNSPLAPKPGLATLPYQAFVPSFGPWGFVIAANRLPRQLSRPLPENLRFLDNNFMARASQFDRDSERVDVEVNTIMEHPLAGYYEAGWRKWFGG